MRKYIFLFVLTYVSISLFSQKQILTLDKAILGGRDLAPSSWSNIQWAKNENILYYSKKGAFIYKYDPAKNRTDSIPFISSVNPKLKALSAEELKTVTAFNLTADGKISFNSGSKNILMDMKSGTLKIGMNTPAKGENIEANEISGQYAYTQDKALWIQNKEGNQTKVIQGNDSIVYGESVHRQEFGIEKGIFWSPKGNKIAFYRMDQSMVTKYPIFNLTNTPATIDNIYYPMAGTKSHHVTIGIYDLITSKITYLETGGDPEHYLTNICWSPDEKEIYIAEINRDQDHTTFNAYNPERGNKIRTLYDETSRQYSEPLTPYTFVPGSNTQLIAQSKRDGWNSLYLYIHEGELLRQLTKDIEVMNLNGFDAKNKFVYFQGILPNSIDLQSFQTELATGKTIQLSQGPGLHNTKQSFDGKYIFESTSSFGLNQTYSVMDTKSKKTTKLFTASEPLDNYNIGATKLDTLYANDGTKLFSRTIFPVDFDPNKKYPAIIYVYGGPHAQMIRNTRLAQAQLWMYTLANEGFIVYTLDNRGSSNRGIKFENVTHRNLGDLEMDDQMKGYDHVIKMGVADESKMGVMGWSYGGFMTISLMTRYPGKFKAAVAGGPVTDWSMYEIMYTERYMDTPQQNPEGYKKASTFNYIDNLSGPMLLIHGTSDDVVVWQQSLNYIQSCVSKGKQIDYFVYPGHKHNVLGKDRVHLIRKIADYFEEKL